MNIHRSGVFYSAILVVIWLVQRETAAVSVHYLCAPCNHARDYSVASLFLFFIFRFCFVFCFVVVVFRFVVVFRLFLFFHVFCFVLFCFVFSFLFSINLY